MNRKRGCLSWYFPFYSVKLFARVHVCTYVCISMSCTAQNAYSRGVYTYYGPWNWAGVHCVWTRNVLVYALRVLCGCVREQLCTRPDYIFTHTEQIDSGSKRRTVCHHESSQSRTKNHVQSICMPRSLVHYVRNHSLLHTWTVVSQTHRATRRRYARYYRDIQIECHIFSIEAEQKLRCSR